MGSCCVCDGVYPHRPARRLIPGLSGCSRYGGCTYCASVPSPHHINNNPKLGCLRRSCRLFIWGQSVGYHVLYPGSVLHKAIVLGKRSPFSHQEYPGVKRSRLHPLPPPVRWNCAWTQWPLIEMIAATVREREVWNWAVLNTHTHYINIYIYSVHIPQIPTNMCFQGQFQTCFRPS